MTQLELLDSARHKLRLARYHADALVRALEEHPTEDLERAVSGVVTPPGAIALTAIP